MVTMDVPVQDRTETERKGTQGNHIRPAAKNIIVRAHGSALNALVQAQQPDISLG